MAGDEILELDINAANVHGVVQIVGFESWINFLFVEKELFADFFRALASGTCFGVEEAEVKGEKVVEMLWVLVLVDAGEGGIF